MKKKAVIIFAMTAMLLTACSDNKKDENKNDAQQPDVTYEKTDSDDLDEGVTEGTEDSDSEATTEATTNEKIETGDTENEPQNNTSAETEASEASSEGEVPPRPDTWTDEDGVERNEKVN